jgi:hypothetical protein
VRRRKRCAVVPEHGTPGEAALKGLETVEDCGVLLAQPGRQVPRATQTAHIGAEGEELLTPGLDAVLLVGIRTPAGTARKGFCEVLEHEEGAADEGTVMLEDRTLALLAQADLEAHR